MIIVDINCVDPTEIIDDLKFGPSFLRGLHVLLRTHFCLEDWTSVTWMIRMNSMERTEASVYDTTGLYLIKETPYGFPTCLARLLRDARDSKDVGDNNIP
jgi:hypothetical protein